MKTRVALALIVMMALAAPPAGAQIVGFWKFDEGFFQPLCPGSSAHNAGGHVVDSSGLNNHGCLENPNRNVKYTTDAFPFPAVGNSALHMNDPLDAAIKNFVGYVFIPHLNTSLEPPTGMIEAAVKIRDYPGTSAIAPGKSTIVFAKSTFQFVRTEPVIPIFLINGQPRIVGRTVYQLEILTNGFLRATVGNNDPLTPAAPWTVAESGAVLGLGVWNRIAMKWDGCRLSVILNGSSSGVPYDPVPILGLSYQGTGNDPTLGPLSLPAQISSDSDAPLIGQIDEVKISRVPPCTTFTIASTNQLISNVQALRLPSGVENSLVSMLEGVVAKLGPDPTPFTPGGPQGGPDPSPFQVAAVNSLGAFINHVEAQRGKKIAPADADALIAVAESIAAGLTIR